MTPRHSLVRADEVEYSYWLTFDEQGSISLTRGQPALDRDQRAMAMTLTVPRSLFKTPQLRATVKVDDPGLSTPSIDVTAAAAALRSVLGCDIDLVVNHPPTPERNAS